MLSDIPSDQAGGTSSFVHRALLFTGYLGFISPVHLLPAWLALVAITAWPWSTLQVPAAGIGTLFLVIDWLMLALLPVKARSWGPVTPPLLALTLLRAALSWALACLFPTLPGLLLLGMLNSVLSAIATYATWIEPFRLTITHQQLVSSRWKAQRPLRLLHISDLHFEGPSPREAAVLSAVQDLQPDLILLTGDYLNLSSVYDPAARAGARRILAQLQAPLGVYAVTGSPVVDRANVIPEIFADLPIHWLLDEALPVCWEGGEFWLVGLRCTYDSERDPAVLERLMSEQVPAGAFSILLYHTPDLMPYIADTRVVGTGVTLYLAGHTHGGQIRLPIYGALATSSRWGKRYEMGRYYEGKTALYVSRGLGMEGLGAPRARFLAPPEIILWNIDKA